MTSKTQKTHTDSSEPQKPRAPKKAGGSLSQAQKGKRKLNANPYSTPEGELPNLLRRQLDQLQIFWTSAENTQRRETPIREQTYKTYRSHILSFLGWLSHIRSQNLEEIGLEKLADRNLLSDFLNWGRAERGNSYGWALNVAQSIMLIVKWQHHSALQQSQIGDIIPEVTEFRDYISTLRYRYQAERSDKKVKQVDSAENQFALTDELCQKIIAYLRHDCAEYNHTGGKRSETALLRSWQRYLITAILMSCPIRLQELCQLEPANDILREPDGSWTIVTTTQHKTGYSGLPIKMKLPEALKKDLATWIEDLRPKIKAGSSSIFVKLGSNRLPDALGQPLTERDIWELVSRATYKATESILGTPMRIKPSMFRQLHVPLLPSQFDTCDQHLSSPQNTNPALTCMPCSTPFRSSTQQQDTKQIAKFFKDLGIALENYNPDTQTLTDLIQQIEQANSTALSASNSLRMAKHLKAILHILEKKIPTK